MSHSIFLFVARRSACESQIRFSLQENLYSVEKKECSPFGRSRARSPWAARSELVGAQGCLFDPGEGGRGPLGQAGGLNFRGLVLGCIEADFCKEILI